MKRTISIMLVLAMVISLAACGAKPAQQPAEPEVIQNVQDVITDSTKTDIGEDITVKPELIISCSAFNSLDPNTTWSYQANEYFRIVFDTLLAYVNGEYVPRVATAWEWTDDTYTAISVTIRDDVYFTNGEKLTAEDVAYSLDRCTYGSVANYYDHSEVASDTELTIILAKPCIEFLYFLADTATSIVCKKAVEEDAEWGFTIGSGPFKMDLDNYIPGDTYVAVRNEEYWGEHPLTEKFTFRVFSDLSASLVAVQNGEIDWTWNVPASEIELAKQDKNIEVLQYGSANVQYAAINTVNGGNLTDLNLRKAVAYAIDKEQIAIAAGQDGARIADSMWSWCAPGYFTDFENPYSYNPDKAKEYVALVDDPSFKITCNGSNTVQKNMALMIQEMCGQVGIDVSIEETDGAGLGSCSKWGSATHEMLMYNISLSDSNTSIWDFYTVNATKNRAFITDEHVQDLLAKAAASEDNAEYYAEIQEINNENVYYIPFFFLNSCYAYPKGLSGVGIRMAGGMDFTYAYLPVEG